MERFFYFLNKGKFRIPICKKCNTKIWPPSNICKNCFSKDLKMSKIGSHGMLIEISDSSYNNNQKIGLVQISGIRIIGIIKGEKINPGILVRLTRCGIDDNKLPYYEFSSE